MPSLGSPGHLLLIASAAEYRLVSFCLHVLRDYLAVHDLVMMDGGKTSRSTSRLASRLLTELTPSLVNLLEGLLALHEPQFVRHLPGASSAHIGAHATTMQPPLLCTSPAIFSRQARNSPPAPPLDPSRPARLAGFYPLFVDLMHCDSKELRQILRDIFSQRIGTVLHAQQEQAS